MITLDGKYLYQIKDLIEELKRYPQDSVVCAIWYDNDKQFHKRSIYKTVETATEVCLYLGDDSILEARYE